MPGELTIKIHAEWTSEEGGGETCALCGETCYLTALNLYVRLNRTKLDAPVASLCNSCEEVAGRYNDEAHPLRAGDAQPKH
jgi:hypothetical protein